MMLFRGSQTCRHADFAGARDFDVGKSDIFQKIHYRGSDFFKKKSLPNFQQKTTTAKNGLIINSSSV